MLWFDSARTRFFWIPEEAAVPAGKLVVRSLRGGGVRQFDEAALAAFEISKEDAQARIDGEVQAVWTQARGAFQKLIDFGRRTAEEAGTPPTEEESRNPLPENLGESLGLSFGAMQTDPEAVKQGLGQLFGRLRDAATSISTAAADRTSPEAAKAGLEEAADQVRTKAPEELAKATAKLRDALNDPKVTDAIHGMADKLHQFADDLREKLDEVVGEPSNPTSDAAEE